LIAAKVTVKRAHATEPWPSVHWSFDIPEQQKHSFFMTSGLPWTLQAIPGNLDSDYSRLEQVMHQRKYRHQQRTKLVGF
jgi:hypothetical protein